MQVEERRERLAIDLRQRHSPVRIGNTIHHGERSRTFKIDRCFVDVALHQPDVELGVNRRVDGGVHLKGRQIQEQIIGSQARNAVGAVGIDAERKLCQQIRLHSGFGSRGKVHVDAVFGQQFGEVETRVHVQC